MCTRLPSLAAATNLVILAFSVSLLVTPRTPLHSQDVDLNLATLDEGAYSQMDMLLRKGFLFIKVNVANVSVRVGPQTAGELQRLVTGSRLNSDVTDSIAWQVINADDALVTMEFVRDVDLSRFLSGIQDGAEKVWKHGVIERSTFDSISQNLPIWYQVLEERGIREGDRAHYRIRGDELHTVVSGADGTVYVDQVDVGRESVLAVLAGYFVEGSDFRNGLVRSLYALDD
jgi:hypothetical protein